MPTVDTHHTSELSTSFRAAKVAGMFDLPTAAGHTVHITANLPTDQHPWNLGLITGASGGGKTTIAQTLWPDATHTSGDHSWTGACLLDDFPDDMTPEHITGLLSAVGFSSPPAWMRPYRALSVGQQMRADLARSLANTTTNPHTPCVFDEFTSTVDRTVAKAVSVATAKHTRRNNTQFVAVTCHKDVEPWLEPDWIYDVDTATFTWGCKRRSPIPLRIREGFRKAWPLFRDHHYLSADLARAARIFLAYITIDDEERLAGFTSYLPVIGHKGWWREHRIVVLPDLQGMGIGNTMTELVAEQLWTQERKRVRATISAPGLVNHRRRHPDMWRLTSKPRMQPATGKTSTVSGGSGGSGVTTSAGRLTTGWVYIPTELRT